jgi:single-strand DNA-binding protein
MDLNKVMIIGRLTRDPEVRTTTTGTNVTSFGVATGRVWVDKNGQKQENTEFHNVVAWGKLGEIVAQYCKKGKQIYIEGRLQTRNWDDKTSGQKRYRTEIIAENKILLGSPTSSSVSQPSQSQSEPIIQTNTESTIPDIQVEDSDIPF